MKNDLKLTTSKMRAYSCEDQIVFNRRYSSFNNSINHNL